MPNWPRGIHGGALLLGLAVLLEAATPVNLTGVAIHMAPTGALADCGDLPAPCITWDEGGWWRVDGCNDARVDCSYVPVRVLSRWVSPSGASWYTYRLLKDVDSGL